MSDIGRVKRGASRMPFKRKSADPFQPEMDEMDSTQDVKEYDEVFSSVVQGPEKTEQNIVNAEKRKKRLQKKKRRRKNEEIEESPPLGDDILLDLKA